MTEEDKTWYSSANPKLRYEFFPPEIIALNEELVNHPDLMVKLGEQQDPDVYIRICEIAAHCNVVLEGTYSRDDILVICEKLTWELKKKSSIMILPDSEATPDEFKQDPPAIQ